MHEYRDDEDLKLFSGQIDVLAFLPIEDIHVGIVYSRDNTAPGAEDLVDYFYQRYVTGTFRRECVPRDGLVRWSSHCSYGNSSTHGTHLPCGMFIRPLCMVNQ